MSNQIVIIVVEFVHR